MSRKNLNLESEGILDPEQSSIPAISIFGIIRNSSGHFPKLRIYRITLYIFRKLQNEMTLEKLRF